MHATPIIAIRQASSSSSSNSTTTTDDAVTTGSGHGLTKTALAIMIPLLVVLAATIIGMVTYFVVRMRRQRLRRAAQRGDGQTDGVPFAVGLQMEEGLNELGEAPPPYVVGGRVVKEPRTNEVVEEVFDEPTEPPPAYLMAPATTTRDENDAS